MAGWVTQDHPEVLFDPAVGPGTFFAAAREAGFTGEFHGFELHPNAFADGWQLGLKLDDFHHVQIADFISTSLPEKFPAIVSNPPYIRHHRLTQDQKLELKQLAHSHLGFSLDGRVGLHVFFLLKCLAQLAPGGRLAFLLPADVCEGISSSAFWNRICQQYQLVAAMTFADEAAPFPTVDTNAMVFLFTNEKPLVDFIWLRVCERDGEAISDALAGRKPSSAVNLHRRKLAEAIKTGLSRPPRDQNNSGTPLSHFAKVVRGIATGDNEFFFLTREQLRSHGLPEKFFRRAIGRTRDCPGDRLTNADLERLEAAGRATWLLNLADESRETLPAQLQAYLERGTHAGLPKKSLIKTRRPWYKMEKRTPPPLLFAYLGRRDCRFVLNEANIVPLTGFLCVYPWDTTQVGARKLWRALNHPDTQANLSFVSKSYGGGALKTEPRQLDQLEIPQSVLDEVGLNPRKSMSQPMLLDKPHHTKQGLSGRKRKLTG
ncbi:MAG: SAM-dependent methyltransferase [Verrucomicrobia bacterium]|nr:SAM-dependent methyltransferase [Verrucomicrobiota bacterium]